MSPAKKTIALWIVLIVFFVAFYQVFSGPPGADAPPRDWVAIIGRWIPLVAVFVGIAWFLRSQQRRHAPANEGVQLLYQGRYEKALERFETYRKANPKEPTGAHNLGTTLLLLWRLEAARTAFEAAKALMPKRAGALAAFIPEHLALTHAFLGNVEEAKRMLTEVPAGESDPGRFNLVQAIVLARAGEWRLAREKLGSFEVKQMRGLGGFARVLDALCIEKLTGERRHVDRLALFGTARPDELAKAWPEFMAFVERAPAW